MRTWVITAAAIWIFIKLPQEYWLHVAEIDVTDTLRDYAVDEVALADRDPGDSRSALVRRPAADPTAGPRAPVPLRPDARVRRHGHRAGRDPRRRRLGLVVDDRREGDPGRDGVDDLRPVRCPGSTGRPWSCSSASAPWCVINAAITLAFSRRNWTFEGAAAAFGIRLAINVGLVLVVKFVMDLSLLGPDTFFFLCMISLMTTLHDRYQPAYAFRQREAADRVEAA